MVKAILDGRKAMTRRVIKPQPEFCITSDIRNRQPLAFWVDNARWVKPRYQPGDILWVRETWYKNYPHKYGRYFYRADGEEIDMPTIYGETIKYGKADGLKWRPSIFMPKEACRLFLKVTNVRVERLQDITDDDAWKEGFERDFPFCEKTECDTCLDECSARYKFNKLWDNLNAKRGYGWDTNPWVFVIEFKRVNHE